MNITRTLITRENNYMEIVERVDDPRRLCYDLWLRCIGCPSALGCRDCLYQELEIRRRYPEWYARLLWYKKHSKGKVKSKIVGKSTDLVIIDDPMKGGDTND